MSNPKINNWSIVGRWESAYDAPETGTTALLGDVVNHPVQGDKRLITSELLHFDLEKKVAKTRSRYYDLGEPCPSFLKYMKEAGFSLEQYQKLYRGDN